MRTMFTAFLLLSLSLAAHAADAPYAGTWLLDVPASRNLPEPMTDGLKEWRLEVQQNATDLTIGVRIVREDGEIAATHKHKLDGTPTPIETTARTSNGLVKVPLTSIANIDASGAINLTLEGEVGGGDAVMKTTRRERLELSADGATLTVHRKDSMPNGEFELALVFRKVQANL